MKRWLLLTIGITAALLASYALAEGAAETTVSASGTSARTGQLGAGTKVLYCGNVSGHYRTGNSAVTATTTDAPIPAGAVVTVVLTAAEPYIAFILDSGTATCKVYARQASPTGQIPPYASATPVNGVDIFPEDITATGTVTANNFVATEDGAAACAVTIATSTYLCMSGNDTAVMTYSGTDLVVNQDLDLSGNDLFGDNIEMTTVSFSGGGAPCLTRGGSTIIQTCSGDSFSMVGGELESQGTMDVWGSLENDANGANCTSNTGAVCVNDAGGLAIANAGTTTSTVSAAGVAVFGASVAITFTTLGTCAAGVEGALRLDTASGVSTGAATRLCMCRSDGSAVYTWINVVTGTNGTATTCAP